MASLLQKAGAVAAGAPALAEAVSGSAASAPPALASVMQGMLQRLGRGEKRTAEGVDPALHEMPPPASRAHWGALGDALKRAERPEGHSVPGEKWMSLRLDGHGFSKHVKALRRRGVIEGTGYSERFAQGMQKSLVALMEATHAWVGYTQSDEMTVLVPPARVIRGVQQCHMRNGRVQKIATLAAARVGNVFNHHLAELWRSGGDPSGYPLELYAEFDCRIGAFDTCEEALGLLMWRSYDSGLNGVADACHQLRGIVEGAKQAVGYDTVEKVKFLAAHDRLPLPPHQAYGSYFLKARREHEGFNPQTGEVVLTERAKIERQEGCCLVNVILAGGLVYKDLRGEPREGVEHSDPKGDSDALAGLAEATA